MSTKIYVFDFFCIYVKESLVRLTLTDEVEKRNKNYRLMHAIYYNSWNFHIENHIWSRKSTHNEILLTTFSWNKTTLLF